ncbi:unnamed protein product [Urochloa humidicola]
MMITLRSEDGEERSMPVAAAAKMSATLRHLIEDLSDVKDAVRINCATGRALGTVIEYCVKHAAAEPGNDDSDDPSGAEDLEKWDRKLVDGLSADDLYDLLVAANFLCIPGLVRVVCQRAADMIKGKTTQQIRNTFNITNDYDFDPADEAEFRREFAWMIASE